MPPVPSACQPLANRVAALEQQYAAASVQASAAIGAPAWAALAQAGPLLQDLDVARAELAACVKTYSAALTATVAVIDASGGAAGVQTATLWDLTGAGPTTAETVQIQGGAFGFSGPLPTSAAVTLAPNRAADASLTGIDFRSGTLPQPLTSTQAQVELVIAPRLTISTERLRAWASSFQPTPTDLDNPGGFLGRMQAVIATPALTLTPGAVRVDLTGTVTRASGGPAFGGFLGPSSLPFSASLMLNLTPATDPFGADAVSVTLAGQAPILVNLPGLQAIVDAVLPLVTTLVADQIVASLTGWLNRLVPGAVARGLALASLPAATRVSLRSLTIDEAGITFQPVLGAVGTLLSTFQPTPLPTPP